MNKQKSFVCWAIICTITGIMLWVNFHYKLFSFNSSKVEISDTLGISIMTFNVAAYNTQNFTVEKRNRLLQLIKQEKPDILCFQELSFDNIKMIKPQLDSIYGSCEVLKGDNQLWRLRFYSHYPLRNFRRHRCEGDIDTSDFTHKEKAEIELLRKQMGVMSAEFEIEPGQWIKIFSGHLRSSAYSTARRSMNKKDSWLKGISLYKRNYEIGKRIRNYEAQNIRRFINEAKDEGLPVIVAGDMNDWCGSDCLNTLMDDYMKDSWWEGGNGFGWTYFGWNLRLRLDHILYSDELKLVDVKVIDSDLSDHKPLVARFKMK